MTLEINKHQQQHAVQNGEDICLFLCLMYEVVFKYVSTLDAGLPARSQYSECPATGQLDTGFSWFPCVYKQMLR